MIWGGEFDGHPPPKGPTAVSTILRFHDVAGGRRNQGGMTCGATKRIRLARRREQVRVHDARHDPHLMGIDHQLYRYSGRDYRLTDVFGNVVEPILA